MTIIRNYNFDTTKVNAMLYDESGFLWLAFAKNSDGVCILQKVSANNPAQVYYEIELAVDEIKALNILGTYLYVAVDDATYLGYRYSRTSPLTVVTAISKPVGITEAPIAIDNDGTYVYFLLPGLTPDIKILKYTTALVLNTTITLTGNNNASSFVIDSSKNLWVVTYESPSKLIRVYDDGGYTFTVHS